MHRNPAAASLGRETRVPHREPDPAATPAPRLDTLSLAPHSRAGSFLSHLSTEGRASNSPCNHRAATLS